MGSSIRVETKHKERQATQDLDQRIMTNGSTLDALLTSLLENLALIGPSDQTFPNGVTQAPSTTS